jgi:hypothetical protein
VADPSLVKFVSGARAKNFDDATIKQTLVNKGWQEAQVNEALSASQTSSSQPVAGSSSVSSTTIPFYKSPLILGVVGIAIFLVVGVIAGLLLLGGGDSDEELTVDVECETDTDCRSGYECSRNSCVAVNEDECQIDDDCGYGYECSRGSCEEAEDDEVEEEEEKEEEEVPEETLTSSPTVVTDDEVELLEDYSFTSHKVTDLNDTKLVLSFDLAYTAVTDDLNSSQVISNICKLSNSSKAVIDYQTLEWNHTLVNSTTSIECVLDVSDLYLNILDEVNVTISYLLDSDYIWVEENETNNFYEENYIWTISHFDNYAAATVSTCTSDSDCYGYDCSTNYMCETSCFDSSGEEDSALCASGYVCDEGVCSEVVSVNCSTNSDCTTEGQVCDTSAGVCAKDCTTNGDNDCDDGYVCESYICVSNEGSVDDDSDEDGSVDDGSDEDSSTDDSSVDDDSDEDSSVDDSSVDDGLDEDSSTDVATLAEGESCTVSSECVEGTYCDSENICAVPVSCVDSDEGLNYETYGNVTGIWYPYNDDSYTDEQVEGDYCSKEYLYENYCDDYNFLNFVEYNCEENGYSGCLEGACYIVTGSTTNEDVNGDDNGDLLVDTIKDSHTFLPDKLEDYLVLDLLGDGSTAKNYEDASSSLFKNNGEYFTFDGSGYIIFEDSANWDLTEWIVIDAYVKPELSTGGPVIVSKNLDDDALSSETPFNVYILKGKSQEGYQFGVTDIGGTRNIAPSSSKVAGSFVEEWTRVTAIWDGADMYIYVNGEVAQTNSKDSMMISDGTLQIGSNPTGTPWTGDIAQLRIWGDRKPRCSDGWDNDGDGRTDYNNDAKKGDPDCESDLDNSEESKLRVKSRAPDQELNLFQRMMKFIFRAPIEKIARYFE